ncbi:MAG TPA: ATP-binding protein [Candidatus Pullichristensenella avicola]|nr:ATP-binding protein [Candidatus Pullichristensenella avicola]
MPELALHILDLVQNSVSAGATRVTVTIVYNTQQDTLTIAIEDDGKGMTPELLERVESPFTTTRTTRKVGLGIPLFKQLAQMCEGSLTIDSAVGKGTKTQACFRASHMDLPPLGDVRGTIETLVIANPERPDFCFIYRVDGEEFVFDTAVVREALGGLPLNEPEIVEWIGQYVAEGIGEVERSRAER